MAVEGTLSYDLENLVTLAVTRLNALAIKATELNRHAKDNVFNGQLSATVPN